MAMWACIVLVTATGQATVVLAFTDPLLDSQF